MKQVGITGGIGSGKTTVARIFHALGIPIFYADLEARTIVESDPETVAAIKTLFGPDVYLEGGRLNRARVAVLVFNDSALLNQLNAIVHPAVGRRYEQWAANHAASGLVPYTLKEAAILFESGSHLALDVTIAVSAPENLRVQRVMARDGATETSIRDRMANQWSETDRNNKADFVIHNDGRSLVIPQVLAVHEQLIG